MSKYIVFIPSYETFYQIRDSLYRLGGKWNAMSVSVKTLDTEWYFQVVNDVDRIRGITADQAFCLSGVTVDTGTVEYLESKNISIKMVTLSSLIGTISHILKEEKARTEPVYTEEQMQMMLDLVKRIQRYVMPHAAVRTVIEIEHAKEKLGL